MQIMRAQIIVDSVSKNLAGNKGIGDHCSSLVSLYLQGLEYQLVIIPEQTH